MIVEHFDFIKIRETLPKKKPIWVNIVEKCQLQPKLFTNFNFSQNFKNHDCSQNWKNNNNKKTTQIQSKFRKSGF